MIGHSNLINVCRDGPCQERSLIPVLPAIRPTSDQRPAEQPSGLIRKTQPSIGIGKMRANVAGTGLGKERLHWQPPATF